MNRFSYLLLLGFLSPFVVDCSADGNGFFMFADFYCVMHSRERENVEYLIDWYFNKEFMMQYNSTVGTWTGFTPAGKITASQFNEDKFDVQQRKIEKQLICVNNVDVIFNGTEENMAEPSITLQEGDHTSSHGVILVCSAYDFYPKHILVTWYLNGQEVTEGVTISEVMTNGDWTYQVHSYLEYTPGPKDRVTCTVEHVSLKEPKISHWDSSLKQSEWSYVTGGVCALLFGALMLSLGLIYYRRKTCDPAFSNPL
ncbi:rano class II histocompatibility antigen, A beta chain-like [Archocentrus centrarchus]|uniref:rano class II histocompatibility antigen, A beta chain-like n=1 Tax=Archocentrus centrarchus TaxID=63155 RepID=UPI0011E9D51B|nr:rano class II histocompatibility antigen, A beta chain-like [Archocentrus centrarchus]